MSNDGTRMILHNQVCRICACGSIMLCASFGVQTRFLYLEANRNVSETWPIPIQFRTDTNSISRLEWLFNASG